MSSENLNKYLQFMQSFVFIIHWETFIKQIFHEIDYIVIKVYDVMTTFSRGRFS